MASGLWPASLAALANAPARYAMAAREHQFGHGLATTLVLSVLADVASLGPLFALVLAPSYGLARRKLQSRRAMGAAFAAMWVTSVLFSAFLWAASVGATEFRIQRGSYPVLGEAIAGLRDSRFIRGSARIALFERYSVPTLIALVALAFLFVVDARHRILSNGRTRHASGVPADAPTGSALLGALGPAVASLGWAGLGSVLFLLLRAMAPAPISDAWIPPLVRLAADAHPSDPSAGAGGVRGVLSSIDLGEATVRGGLHWLGFGDAHARCLVAEQRLPCAPHPLARPLPGDIPSPVSNARDEEPTPLVQAFLALSAALFDHRETPLTIWHVALESFRADDVHALHSAAPENLTPFVDAAYAPSKSGGPQTIAFRHAFQSGLRTAHAVSGLWCGLGALPFQLALSRDLVDLPLRCMPDVLHDAGFDTRIYYGSNASFEQLGAFAFAHGLAMKDVSTLPPDLPRGAFRAVTDAALLGVAEGDALSAPPLAYRFVLTLSGHSPFDLPEDVSPMTQTRAGNAISARSPISLTSEDRRRLVTMAYADDAIAAFVQKIESTAQAAHSIFLVSADHATADPFLWEKPTGEAWARVPLFLYLPASLIASSSNPRQVEETIHSLDALAATLPVSINDVPTLLLALLARHGALEHLARERRWHSLGGATSSSLFEAVDTTTAQVWGIDARSRVFLVRSDAVDQLLETGERSIAFSVWDEPLGPLLKDVTGALSALLRACSGPRADESDEKKCSTSSAQSIRH